MRATTVCRREQGSGMRGSGGSWADGLSPAERRAFAREELIDVVVEPVGIPQWQRFLDYVKQRYAFSFIVDGEKAPLPDTAEEMLGLPRLYPLGLRIEVGNLSVNEYFLEREVIDLDMSPREIRDPSDVAAFLSFLRGLAAAVEVEVVVRVEGPRDDDRGVLFRLAPGDEQPRYCV